MDGVAGEWNAVAVSRLGGIYFRYGTMIVSVFYLNKILRSMFMLETIFCIDNINEVISLYLLL